MHIEVGSGMLRREDLAKILCHSKGFRKSPMESTLEKSVDWDLRVLGGLGGKTFWDNNKGLLALWEWARSSRSERFKKREGP